MGQKHLGRTRVNKFATLNHTALILGVHALRSYLKLVCEYELHSLPNKKVSGTKDHGKNYIRPPLVRHLLRDGPFSVVIIDFPYLTGRYVKSMLCNPCCAIGIVIVNFEMSVLSCTLHLFSMD